MAHLLRPSRTLLPRLSKTSRLILLPSASPTTLRLYHSASHPQPAPYPPLETAILSAALAHIPAHGFSASALALGARDAGYGPVAASALLPRGAFDLVLFWLAGRRLALAGVVDGDAGLRARWDEGRVGVGARVRALVGERLRMNAAAGVVPRWPQVGFFGC
jgi:ubiquinone biosynthesis protein COQ9